MYAPTATAVGGVLSGPHGDLLSEADVTTADLSFADQYTIGRTTLNLGARYDHYSGWTPGQQQSRTRSLQASSSTPRRSRSRAPSPTRSRRALVCPTI
jgi:hypothetical protein